MVWPKPIKHPFRILGRCGKKCESNSLAKQLNVNEEYKEAFRTQSYIDICSKVQGHMQMQEVNNDELSSFPLFVHDLTESLVEPGQETLADIIQSYNLHPLLVDYFKITTQACNLCEFFLQSIRQTRANYRIIKRVIKLSKRTRNYTDDQCCTAMFKHLASFASKKNPLSSIISPFEFRQTQATRNDLLHQLTLQCRKITRRIKLRKCFKKIVGCTIVVAYTALAIALLVLAFHSMVGIVTAPAVLTCSIGFFKRQKKLRNKSRLLLLKVSSKSVGTQLDLAAKGVYILINDFNTMSRLVRRLNDEIEHRIAMANMCARNGKAEVLREVVREFRMEETCLLEQLEELEDHIYLCFLTINRSRRLLVEELTNGATIKL